MTPRLRVALADDERLARQRLSRLLSAMPDVELVGECESAEALLALVAKLREAGAPVDVVLLDIHMPGLSGMEAAELLPEDGPLVVLCTAHAEHAVVAFERGAVDYLLKPAEAARLNKALGRVRERLPAHRASARRAGGAADDDAAAAQTQTHAQAQPAFARLAVPTRGGIVLLDPREISHATLDGELVTIVTSGPSYLSDATMTDLQDRLPSSLFARVHRRQLLNLEHVVRLEPQETGGYLAHTRSGHAVEISRQAARELRKRLHL